MVAGGESFGFEIPRGADDFLDDEVVLAADGNIVEDRVRKLFDEFVEARSGLIRCSLGLLHRAGKLLGAGQQNRLFLAFGLGNLLAEILLLGALRLEGSDRCPSGLIGENQIIHQFHGLPSRLLGATEQVRVGA